MPKKQKLKEGSHGSTFKRVSGSTPVDDSNDKYKLVPPDGGWGWVIVFAASICNSVVQCPTTVFPLLYQGTMEDAGLSGTDKSIIVNLSLGLLYIFGFFNSIPLKKYGCRATTVAGMVISSLGWFLCAYSTSFWHFILSYSITTGLGSAMVYSTQPVAISMYFSQNRGKAMGLSMTITSLCMIAAPPLTILLMDLFGVLGTGIIQAGFALNGLVTALLLQPVRWHMRRVQEHVDEVGAEGHALSEVGTNGLGANVKLNEDKSYSQVKLQDEESKFENMKSSTNSKDSIDNFIYLDNGLVSEQLKSNLAEDNQDRDSKDRQANAETRKPTTLFKRVADFLDLRLLKDTTLLVLVLGLSLAVAAETTFSYSTPLILFDMNFGPDQTAYIMSFITAGDILTRFLCPFIADWLRLEARSMYVLGLCVVLMSRFSILITSNFQVMLGVGLCLGMGKGIRSVYMNLVVPAYVSIDKVASALALQNLGVGVINLLISPLLGFLKDIHGSYSVSVIVLNMATLLVIVVLLVESVLNRRKKNVRSKPGSSHSQ